MRAASENQVKALRLRHMDQLWNSIVRVIFLEPVDFFGVEFRGKIWSRILFRSVGSLFGEKAS